LRENVPRFARDSTEHFPLAVPLAGVGARAAEGQESIADVHEIFRPSVLRRDKSRGQPSNSASSVT